MTSRNHPTYSLLSRVLFGLFLMLGVGCGEVVLRPVNGRQDIDMTTVDRCANGALDGLESDVDCGGPECEACSLDEQCNQTQDCQSLPISSWGACNTSQLCDVEGTQTRVISLVECKQRRCVIVPKSESRPCVPPSPQGKECAPRVERDWRVCLPAQPGDNVCVDGGTQKREVVSFACDSGECVSSKAQESRPCVINEVLRCAPTVLGTEPDDCAWRNQCETQGRRGQKRTAYFCSEGECKPLVSLETRPCFRETENQSCSGLPGAKCVQTECVLQDAGCTRAADCDDKDPCTTNRCNQGRCVYTPQDKDEDGFACDVDCHDGNGNVHPQSSSRPVPFYANPYERPDGTMSYDYDCNGLELRNFNRVATLCQQENTCGGSGWKDTANTGQFTIPECGSRAAFEVCTPGDGMCSLKTEMRRQKCR